MTDKIDNKQKTDELNDTGSDRRRFLKRAGTVAATAPAVTLLLNRQANAGVSPAYEDPTIGGTL